MLYCPALRPTLLPPLTSRLRAMALKLDDRVLSGSGEHVCELVSDAACTVGFVFGGHHQDDLVGGGIFGVERGCDADVALVDRREGADCEVEGLVFDLDDLGVAFVHGFQELALLR